jgi:hypothetical protein
MFGSMPRTVILAFLSRLLSRGGRLGARVDGRGLATKYCEGGLASGASQWRRAHGRFSSV